MDIRLHMNRQIQSLSCLSRGAIQDYFGDEIYYNFHNLKIGYPIQFLYKCEKGVNRRKPDLSTERSSWFQYSSRLCSLCFLPWRLQCETVDVHGRND